MLWFKRNLFLAVTGLAALVLLGGGIFFVMAGRTRNAGLDQGVEETRGQLNNIYNKDPFPHATNIDAARKEVAKLHGQVQQLTKYFAPVPVDSREFLATRDRTLSELRDAALKANVGLPGPGAYAFSFEVQKGKVGSFGYGTFPTVPQQMAEVKALCAALYEARISRILNIRRARASADDNASTAPVQDYTPGVGITSNVNAQAISHPFELTFTCFSGEIGQVLTSLAKSPHGFVVKAVQIEPENLQVADAGGPVMAAAEPAMAFGQIQPQPPGRPGLVRQPSPPVRPGGRQPLPNAAPPPRVPPGPVRPGVQAPASDRPIVLLKERRLRVTMLVYAIKPAK